jgi:DNA-binding response OmpR family regulator
MPEGLATQRGSIRVLLIDDRVTLSRAISKTLGEQYQVIPAQTGAEARRKLHHFRPDLIVLELMLPDIDGLLLMIQLKAQTDAAIVVCTTRDDLVDRALCRRLGAVDFIAKPIKMSELKVRLAAAASLHAQQ